MYSRVVVCYWVTARKGVSSCEWIAKTEAYMQVRHITHMPRTTLLHHVPAIAYVTLPPTIAPELSTKSLIHAYA
jgi:hypothetical protein